MRVGIERVTARLSAPFVSAAGSVLRRELLLLRLEADDGHTGFGEAAPLQDYDGVSIDDCRSALEDCRAALREADASPREPLLAECRRLAALPQATAAVDLALWDLAGKRARQPVWRLLGASDPGAVEVNYTVAAPDRAGAAAQAAAARQAGYRALKLKVGMGDDAGRLAAVRAASGPEMSIRLDANGAWTVSEARDALTSLEAVGIELCEEPVHGLEQMADLSSLTSVPLALDETAVTTGALDRRVCTAACLKIAPWGGITRLIEASRRARNVGYEVYLASSLDGPLGIAAALHAAAVIAPERPCGLATLPLLGHQPGVLAPRAGRISPSSGAGLGDGLIEWYRTGR